MKRAAVENRSQKGESRSPDPTRCLETAGKAKILIIEDDTPLAMMMVAALTQAGFDVTTACNGRKGLELAATKKFDLITLDMGLPDITGFEICRDLKQRHISHRTPIVFVTGRPREEDRRLVFELGAADYIAKPFEAGNFIKRLLSHIIPTEAAT